MNWPDNLNIPQHINYLAGIDEVGRGALAGPMTIGCAVVHRRDLNYCTEIPNLKDSKLLNSISRESIVCNNDKDKIQLFSDSIAPTMIDREGIRKCYLQSINRFAKKIIRANAGVRIKLDNIMWLVDYGIPKPDIIDAENWRNYKKGDQHYPVIALASIYAKQIRDKKMKNQLHLLYPEYGFNTNVGYGTQKHIQAIKVYGLTDIHRKSFNVTLDGKRV